MEIFTFPGFQLLSDVQKKNFRTRPVWSDASCHSISHWPSSSSSSSQWPRCDTAISMIKSWRWVVTQPQTFPEWISLALRPASRGAPVTTTSGGATDTRVKYGRWHINTLRDEQRIIYCRWGPPRPDTHTSSPPRHDYSTGAQKPNKEHVKMYKTCHKSFLQSLSSSPRVERDWNKPSVGNWSKW